MKERDTARQHQNRVVMWSFGSRGESAGDHPQAQFHVHSHGIPAAFHVRTAAKKRTLASVRFVSGVPPFLIGKSIPV